MIYVTHHDSLYQSFSDAEVEILCLFEVDTTCKPQPAALQNYAETGPWAKIVQLAVMPA